MDVDWANKIINVYKADMVLVQSSPTTIYQLDIDYFRGQLNDLQDDPDGIVYPTTHNHVAPISVGGVQLARVVEVLAPYTVTFEDGQYAVNLVGANSNIADRVNVNQVSVRSANSAGLPHLETLQLIAFDSAVSIDTSSAYSGVQYPVGTTGYPVNNVPDAKQIAEINRISVLRIVNTLDLGSEQLIEMELRGRGSSLSELTIPVGADISRCVFRDITVSGFLDGSCRAQGCFVGNLNYVSGTIEDSVLTETVRLAGNEPAYFMRCKSGLPNAGVPTIDCGGAGQALVIRDYNGRVRLTNKTGPEPISIDLNSGQVRVDLPTVTGGYMVVRGVGVVVDDATGTPLRTGVYGGLTLVNETIYGKDVRQIHEAHYNRRKYDSVAGTITIYEDDKVAPAHVFDATPDMSEITPQ